MPLVDFVADQEAAQKVQSQLIEHRTGLPSVHKFGGSSLRSAEAINRVADIIQRDCGAKDLVVLSAMGKTTDMLFELVASNRTGDEQVDLTAVRAYQTQVISALLPGTIAAGLLEELANDLQRIEFLLTHATQSQSLRADDIICFGELWSTRVVTAVLQHRGVNCQRVDARDFIYTADPLSINAAQADEDTVIDWDQSREAFVRWSEEFSGKLSIVTGYIATDHQGDTVTLGRNGSDFSATIIAKLAQAGMVFLWTDVNGVFSADPNRFNNTRVIPLLGLDEASALANLGTPVFHEKTLKPLRDSDIPIRIRNSQAADEKSAGTLILTRPVKWQGAKTLALKEAVCLFRIRWHNGQNHQQSSAKLKQLLVSLHISNYCWLDEASRLSFCVAEKDQTTVAKLLTRQCVGEGCQFSVNKDLSIISLVGYELLQHGEHLAAFFSFIEQSKKGVLQYHYDHNGAISAVIEDRLPVQLVSKIHSAVFVGSDETCDIAFKPQDGLALVVVGYGNIGRKLIDILSARLALINRRARNKIRVVGLCNSRHYVFDAAGLDLTRAEELLDGSIARTSEIEKDLELVRDSRIVIVDATASYAVTGQYLEHFSKGRHIVSAAKLGMTLPSAQYRQLNDTARANGCRWLSNVTCGAGLPLQQVLEDLTVAGDIVKRIEGVFSGTLSWLLRQYDGSEPFCSVVDKAKRQGLTEPDPRDDLSGKDVQRKLLIIARTLGCDWELEQIELTPLIPREYLALPEQTFFDRQGEVDAYMKEKWQQAADQGLQLCYSGELEFVEIDGRLSLRGARVGLSFRASGDPLVNLAPADNIAVIRSQWHDNNPLIIRGPGAGIEVTAAGILSDLLKLTQ